VRSSRGYEPPLTEAAKSKKEKVINERLWHQSELKIPTTLSSSYNASPACGDQESSKEESGSGTEAEVNGSERSPVERRRGIGISEVKRSTRSTERPIPISVWTVAVRLKSGPLLPS